MVKNARKEIFYYKKKIYTYTATMVANQYHTITKRDGNTGEVVTGWNNAGTDNLIQVYYSVPYYKIRALVPAVYNG